MPVGEVGEFEFPGGPVGCLLIHGFSGTPFEMRYLGERLRECGHAVRGVLLPGHATRGSELFTSGWRQWYGAAAGGVDELRRSCDRVAVVGVSMGALLALRLARERAADVHAVVLLAPALVLADRRVRRYAPLARTLLPLLPRRWQLLGKAESDIADAAARERHPRFPLSLRGLVELAALQRLTRPLLPQITQPVLVLHGRLDRTCLLDNLDIVRREIGSRTIRSRVFERSAHVLTVDAEKALVADEVAAFIAAATGSVRD